MLRTLQRPMSAMPKTRSGIIRPVYDSNELMGTFDRNNNNNKIKTFNENEIITDRIIEEDIEIKKSTINTEETPILDV